MRLSLPFLTAVRNLCGLAERLSFFLQKTASGSAGRIWANFFTPSLSLAQIAEKLILSFLFLKKYPQSVFLTVQKRFLRRRFFPLWERRFSFSCAEKDFAPFYRTTAVL